MTSQNEYSTDFGEIFFQRSWWSFAWKWMRAWKRGRRGNWSCVGRDATPPPWKGGVLIKSVL